MGHYTYHIGRSSNPLYVTHFTKTTHFVRCITTSSANKTSELFGDVKVLTHSSKLLGQASLVIQEQLRQVDLLNIVKPKPTTKDIRRPHSHIEQHQDLKICQCRRHLFHMRKDQKGHTAVLFFKRRPEMLIIDLFWCFFRLLASIHGFVLLRQLLWESLKIKFHHWPLFLHTE